MLYRLFFSLDTTSKLIPILIIWPRLQLYCMTWYGPLTVWLTQPYVTPILMTLMSNLLLMSNSQVQILPALITLQLYLRSAQTNLHSILDWKLNYYRYLLLANNRGLLCLGLISWYIPILIITLTFALIENLQPLLLFLLQKLFFLLLKEPLKLSLLNFLYLYGELASSQSLAYRTTRDAMYH